VDSAEQALRLLEQEDFFMIITDARLNGMSVTNFSAVETKSGPPLRS